MNIDEKLIKYWANMIIKESYDDSDQIENKNLGVDEIINICSNSPDMTELEIPDGYKTIDEHAFEIALPSIKNEIKKIIIPNSVKTIGQRAFKDCYTLESVTIGKNVTNIGVKAFLFCTGLKEVVFKGKTFDYVKKMKGFPWGLNYGGEKKVPGHAIGEPIARDLNNLIKCEP